MEMLNKTTVLFTERNISNPRLNAELLLCDVMNCDRLKLYMNFDKPVSEGEKNTYREYVRRRIKREPLQYILGKTSFYGFEICVDRNVLIPRPETELLVEKVLDDIKSTGKTRINIFEIGTGSGCIAIALANEMHKLNFDFDILAIDASEGAVSLARSNLKKVMPGENRVRFESGDIFAIESLRKDLDYIVSNPPYISNEEYLKLDEEVRDFEPGMALTDFQNGLKFYEKIFRLAHGNNLGGKIFCEIGFGQREEIESLSKSFEFSMTAFYKDYAGIDRIMEAVK